MVEANLITFEQISEEMTDGEYADFLMLLENKGYLNHAIEGSDGTLVSVNDCIMAGIEVLSGLTGDK